MDINPSVPSNPYRNSSVDNRSEAFAKLIDGEVDFMVPERFYDNEESRNLRRYAVQYIEDFHWKAGRNFDTLIPYTAMTYFDICCSVGDVPLVVGDTQLDLCLSCCLAIAWTFRTDDYAYPRYLVRKKCGFTWQDMNHMELEITKCLKRRSEALTPFSFIEYFLQMLDLLPNLQSPLRPVQQLILTSQCDEALTKYRPSVVAASAMLLVAKMMFPTHRRVLEMRIRNSEILNPHVNMILECERKLEPLCSDPPMPAAREGPSSSSAEELEPLFIDPPAAPREGPSTLGADKQPAPGEIRLTVAESKSDPSKPTKLMHFELGWVEALKKLDADRDATAGDDNVDYISGLAEKLNDFCNGLGQGCHIM